MYTKQQIEETRSTSVVEGILTELRSERDDIVKRHDKIEFRIKNDELDNDQVKTLTEQVEGLGDEARQINELIDVASRTLNMLNDEKRAMIERQFTEQNRIDFKGSNEDVYASTEYRNAWAESIRKNDPSILQRFVSTTGTAPNNGGVVIPTELAEKIERGIREGGTIAGLTKMTNIKGYLEVVLEGDTDDASFRKEDAKDIDEENISLEKVAIKPGTITKFIDVTTIQESMAIADFATWLIDEIANKILIALDKAIISGESTKDIEMPTGILSVTDTTLVAEYDAKAVMNFQTPFFAQAQLTSDTLGTVTAVMNRQTFFENYITSADKNENPVFTVLNDNAGNPRYFFGGLPVKFNSTLPAWGVAEADDYPIIIGDFKGYTTNLPNGNNIDLLRDNVSQRRRSVVRYLGEMIAGGNVTSIGKFVKIKKGTGTPS